MDSRTEMAIPNSAPGSTTTSTRCHHLDLPLELRLYIYELLFGSLSDENESLTKAEAIHCLALLHTSHEIYNDAKGTFKNYRRALVDRFLSGFLATEGAAKGAAERAHGLSIQSLYEAWLFPRRDQAKREDEYKKRVNQLERESELLKIEAAFWSRMAGMVRRCKR